MGQASNVPSRKTGLAKLALYSALAAVVALPASAATTTWQIDPAHTAAGFAVRHLMISTVRGQFKGVNGTVVFDDQDISKSMIDVTIDAKTVDTSEPKRDEDLRSDKFFDTAKYPTITFKSKKIENVSAGKLKVTGDLTIHGVTKEVALDIDGPSAPIKNPMGPGQRMGAAATTKINRQDFGMTNMSSVVGDEVNIQIDVELVQ